MLSHKRLVKKLLTAENAERAENRVENSASSAFSAVKCFWTADW
jgi:hypothetical protein